MPIDTTLPGDLSVMDTVGMGEGEPIWDRMAKIIRSRRLDVRQLMAGFDRSKKGFFDLATLRRAFSNAFSATAYCLQLMWVNPRPLQAPKCRSSSERHVLTSLIK